MKRKQLKKIIEIQQEMIGILEENIKSRDKFIEILERQLKITEKYINQK
jgi:hypothetical protein